MRFGARDAPAAMHVMHTACDRTAINAWVFGKDWLSQNTGLIRLVAVMCKSSRASTRASVSRPPMYPVLQTKAQSLPTITLTTMPMLKDHKLW